MPQCYTELPVATSTAYAQLQTAALSVELTRDVSHLRGSFSTKAVKGSLHWYFSFRQSDQRVRQIYVGPDNADVRALVAKARDAKLEARLQPLAQSAMPFWLMPINWACGGMALSRRVTSTSRTQGATSLWPYVRPSKRSLTRHRDGQPLPLPSPARLLGD